MNSLWHTSNVPQAFRDYTCIFRLIRYDVQGNQIQSDLFRATNNVCDTSCAETLSPGQKEYFSDHRCLIGATYTENINIKISLVPTFVIIRDIGVSV